MDDITLFEIALKCVQKNIPFDMIKYIDDLDGASDNEKLDCMNHWEDIRESGIMWAERYLEINKKHI